MPARKTACRTNLQRQRLPSPVKKTTEQLFTEQDAQFIAEFNSNTATTRRRKRVVATVQNAPSIATFLELPKEVQEKIRVTFTRANKQNKQNKQNVANGKAHSLPAAERTTMSLSSTTIKKEDRAKNAAT